MKITIEKTFEDKQTQFFIDECHYDMLVSLFSHLEHIRNMIIYFKNMTGEKINSP